MDTTRSPRTLPFLPLMAPRTVWLFAVVWVPLVRLVDMLVRGTGAWNWAISVQQLLALAWALVAARAALGMRTRKASMAVMAAGAVLAATASMLFTQSLLIEARVASLDAALPMAVIGLVKAPFIAAWQALLAFLLYPFLHTTSHERKDRALLAGALWLSFPFGLLVPALPLLALFWWGDSAYFLRWMTTDVVLLGLAPLAVATLALARIALRRRWLRLVEAGRISGWQLLDSAASSPADLPIVTGSPGEPGKILARVAQVGDGGDPFRSSQLERVALVAPPSPCSLGRRA